MEKIFKQAEIVAREWAESNIRRNVTKFTFDEEYEICIRLYLSYNIEVEVKQNGFAGYQEYEQKMESIYQQFKRWRDEERRNYAEPFVKGKAPTSGNWQAQDKNQTWIKYITSPVRIGLGE